MILINPLSQRLGDFYRYLPVSPHIGIGTLAGYLLSKGKKVKILDDDINPITDGVLGNSVKSLSKPYIFGISCVTAGIGRGYGIAKFIKTKYPDSKVILGGIHPTVLPDEALQTGNVDIVVRGEGEETLDLLYDAIKNKQDYSKIPGISFMEDGHVVHNPAARVFADLDLLPPFPYYLFEGHLDRYNFGFILTARGCPYDCIFCSQRLISGRRYRYTSCQKVIDMLDLLINKYNQRSIVFLDDNFLVNKERIRELCNLIIRRGFHKKSIFHCQARGDSIDTDSLRHLGKANFKYIGFGIETASERLMKLINKQETVQDNINAVKLAKKFGFKVTATFIFGLPTETKEERWSAYKLAKTLDIDFARFNNATPYPGTKLFEIAKEEIVLNVGKNWGNLNACGSLSGGYFDKTRLAYVPKGTNEEELKRDVFKANLCFYLRPKSILRIIREGMIPSGWFLLPKRWYIKPNEWYYLFRLFKRLVFPKV